MSKIEWTEQTWNPVTGCSKISEGCRNCYAEQIARGKRLRGRYGYDRENPFQVTWHPERLDRPFLRRKPTVYFVCSMGDLFHPAVKWEWFDQVMHVMRATPRHRYLLLTKRPARFKLLCDEQIPWPLPNVGIGVSVENQATADERILALRSIPAAMRFVSVEPLLGPVDVMAHVRPSWVICGGETGPGARPMDVQWARDLRDQCVASGVPFFFKKEGNNGNRKLDGRLWEQRPEWFSQEADNG